MGNEFAIELSQEIPFGILKFRKSAEEVAILKLISCDEGDAIKYWEQLWENTEDYEDLLFSIKELMPSAVRKIQTSCEDGQWKQFVPKNAQFLAGLPRYTWTKNQYIINEYQKIAAVLDQEKIEFLALKGLCEMLDGSKLSFMRTSRDIDILIHEEDWLKCKKVFNNLGWFQSKKSRKWTYLNSPIKGHGENFQKLERIFDLDVHFASIPGAKSTSQKFTTNLWKRKVKAKNFPTYYIPSPEDRYIISVGNVFNIGNMIQGHTTKYMYDIHTLSSQIDNKQLVKITADAESHMKLSDLVRQTAIFVNKINGNPRKSNSNKYRINLSVSKNFLNHINRLLFMIQLVKMLFKGTQVIHVLIFFTSRVFMKFLNMLKWNLFTNTIESPHTNRSIIDHPNRFTIQFFHR
jgi:hypothetical protein